MITSYFPRCGASTACERAGLPCLLVCYRTLARLLPQAKAQPALSHLRRGEDTYAIDAIARSTLSEPVAVPHACCTLGAVDALTAVVRARPREAPRSRQKKQGNAQSYDARGGAARAAPAAAPTSARGGPVPASSGGPNAAVDGVPARAGRPATAGRCAGVLIIRRRISRWRQQRRRRTIIRARRRVRGRRGRRGRH